MIEIQAYCPKPTQIGAHLRIVSPLAFLRRDNPGMFHVEYETDCDLYKMMQADICILQRPFSDGCVERAKVAKLAGCKLWIDWDDDLTRLSHSNKAWKFYQFPGLLDNLKALQEMADVITVTTDALAKTYGEHLEKVWMLPNSIEDRLIPAEPPEGTRKAILWRGSDSHAQDLAHFRDAMIGADVYPEWTYVFIGKNPEIPLYGLDPNSWKSIPECQYYEMMEIMGKFAAPIHIVPLFDNQFNRAKSNLAYIEATVAGSVVLAPDWPEWRMPGVWHYDDPASFQKNLKHMTECPIENLRERNRSAFEYVRKSLSMSAINKIRLGIIQELSP